MITIVLRIVTAATSKRMKSVRQSGTAPELAVRDILRALKHRYRTCVKDLPGRPDIVNRRAGWAIFVHGCFWHGHSGCKLATLPKTNSRFWREKLAGNRKRDSQKTRALRRLGFRVITVWQCETRDTDRLRRRLERALTIRAPIQMRGNDAVYLRSPRGQAPSAADPVRVADLFSGAGGLSLGVEEAARTLGRPMSVRLAVEACDSIADTYAANFSPIHGATASSISDWIDGSLGAELTFLERRTRTRVGSVDILVGGPPCQGHSALNNHTRGDDPKNALYLRMVRAAQVLEPTSIVIENVPGVEHDAQRTFERAARGLEGLGYKLSHGIVCVGLVGVPQLRRRHVLLAHTTTKPDLEAAMNAAHAGARSVRWAIGDLRHLEGSTDFHTAAVLTKANEKRAAYLLKHQLFDLPNRKRPECQRSATHRYKSMYGRLDWKRPAQTITTGFGSPGQGRYLHPDQLRTLSPHEAARLQFFPDWFDVSKLEYKRDLARAIGNAVPSKLGFVLAHHLLTLDVASVARTSAATPPMSISARTVG